MRRLLTALLLVLTLVTFAFGATHDLPSTALTLPSYVDPVLEIDGTFPTGFSSVFMYRIEIKDMVHFSAHTASPHHWLFLFDQNGYSVLGASDNIAGSNPVLSVRTPGTYYLAIAPRGIIPYATPIGYTEAPIYAGNTTPHAIPPNGYGKSRTVVKWAGEYTPDFAGDYHIFLAAGGGGGGPGPTDLCYLMFGSDNVVFISDYVLFTGCT